MVVCCAFAAADKAPAKKPLAPRDDLPGLKNFAEVSPALWRGAQPTDEGFAELKKRGVKTIVNLRNVRSDRDNMKGTGLAYVHLHCRAENPEEEDVLNFLKIVENPKNRPVFVHCQHGADRTGSMVAAYRIVEQGWTADEAIAEIRAFGYHGIFRDILTFTRALDRNAIAGKLESVKPPKIDVVP